MCFPVMLDTQPGAELPTQASRGQFCGLRQVCETTKGGASVLLGPDPGSRQAGAAFCASPPPAVERGWSNHLLGRHVSNRELEGLQERAVPGEVSSLPPLPPLVGQGEQVALTLCAQGHPASSDERTRARPSLSGGLRGHSEWGSSWQGWTGYH